MSEIVNKSKFLADKMVLRINTTYVGKIVVPLFLTGLFGTVQAQKGEKSITAGLLLSFPTQDVLYASGFLKTGFGLEATGQSNISQNSALLLQTGLVGYGYKPYTGSASGARLVLFSLKGGYRYQFGATGIFLNVLAGIDVDLTDFAAPLSIPVGAGKRFKVKDVYFMDVSIDYVASEFFNRVNCKAVFSILRRPKPGNNKLL